MRLLATIAVAGTFLTIANLQAQSLAEHAAAAAGATIGTAAGKPLSGAITKIFGETDDQLKTTNHAITKPSTRTPPPVEKLAPGGSPGAAIAPIGGSGDPGPLGSSGGSAATSPSAAPASRGAAVRHLKPAANSTAAFEPTPSPFTTPVVIEPPAPKQPTLQEVSGIQVGASEKDVLATLGVPASHVTVPDDDGHLRESLQYWANGSQLGTIRLDNGVVSTVETRRN